MDSPSFFVAASPSLGFFRWTFWNQLAVDTRVFHQGSFPTFQQFLDIFLLEAVWKNRCSSLWGRKIIPKRLVFFPGCLKKMCIIWENSGKNNVYIYIYIYMLFMHKFMKFQPGVLTYQCFNKSVKKTTPRNLQPLLLAQTVQWDSSRPSFCLKEYTTLHSLPVDSPQHLTDEARSLFRFNEKNNQEDGELDRFFFADMTQHCDVMQAVICGWHQWFLLSHKKGSKR